MGSLLELLGLAVLLFIAAELYVISRELFRLSRSLPQRIEGKEGQTINVNLGQIPVGGPPLEGSGSRSETKEAEIPAPALAPPEGPEELPVEEEPEPEAPPPPPPPRPTAGARATTSGLVALKCSKCGSENSNYRSECFNCGEKLR